MESTRDHHLSLLLKEIPLDQVDALIEEMKQKEFRPLRHRKVRISGQTLQVQSLREDSFAARSMLPMQKSYLPRLLVASSSKLRQLPRRRVRQVTQNRAKEERYLRRVDSTFEREPHLRG